MDSRILALCLSIFFCFSLFAQPAESYFRTVGLYSYTNESKHTIPNYTDEELLERLSKINSQVVQPRLTPAVKSYIKTYTVLKREKTEDMLGRASTYFPLIEKHLQEADMPTDLKYLAVVESALNPRAVSRSRAVGMWQFMSPTGRENGLKINSLVDERKDPNKATEAAIKYLRFLHRKYGNWELALAAYNGGPGRVNRAVRRGRSKDFWRIKRYLPRETRAYVPAFIAATYIMKFYDEHALVPRYPEMDMQLIETVKIYERISFQMISEISGAPMDIIQKLNPSYQQRFLPTNRKGNYLILPMRYMPAVRQHFKLPDSRNSVLTTGSVNIPTRKTFLPPPMGYVSHRYTVEEGDRLTTLATTFNCTEEDIINWNRLRSPQLLPGQHLMIYLPPRRSWQMAPSPTLPSLDNWTVAESNHKPSNLPVDMTTLKNRYYQTMEQLLEKDKRYVYYQLRRRESLMDVMRKFPNTSIPKILDLNNVESSRQLKPGMRIRIGKL
jgi:membrane-bound lytic murein transglycosylase D